MFRWFCFLSTFVMISSFALQTKAQQTLQNPSEPINEASAASVGWEARRFDFSNPATGFTAFLPKGAHVETVPDNVDALEPKSAARTRIVAKFTVPTPYGDVTGQAITFMTPSMSATGSICEWLLEEAGYIVASSWTKPDLTAAKSTGLSANRREGAFVVCLARGRQVLALNYGYNAGASADQAKVDALLEATRRIAQSVTFGLRFENAREPWYEPSDQETIPVVIGADRWEFHVPDIWTVWVNDFKGQLPAQLVLQRADPDLMPAALVFSVIPTTGDRPLIEAVADAALMAFRNHWVAAANQKMVTIEKDQIAYLDVDKRWAEIGLDAASMRMTLKDANGQSRGDLSATLVRKDGKAYLLYLWSSRAYSIDRNIFFTRQPGVTSYLAMREALKTILK